MLLYMLLIMYRELTLNLESLVYALHQYYA